MLILSLCTLSLLPGVKMTVLSFKEAGVMTVMPKHLGMEERGTF